MRAAWREPDLRVLAATHRGAPVAVKQLVRQREPLDVRRFVHEVKLLPLLVHPHVVRFVGAV